MAQTNAPEAAPDRIDPNDPQSRARWTRELDCTEDQLREAVRAVGADASDVELHLKGARSSTNADRVHEADSG
ncbi:DUF3606 domain-containing protein [Ramlibacter tataouinensis]|uniref:DUF3606 domain-containing protein n=1 Tax=Ramlibacter tataouinensis TaxID=94132 RepID=UPI0022F3A1B2|nr:DUF3606 domain-containing protein [Ramlibacter tataouinensis]WBY03914.1 DUF3606 domain-containing protein [Ramlibacter tataouinensis]